jgi:DNA modification methylase
VNTLNSLLKQLPKYKVEWVPLNRLKGWPQNPRIMSDEQKAALLESITRFGMPDPIIADRHWLIAGGHQRMLDLKAAGYRGTVPVVRIKRNLTKAEFATLNLALNKISGEWDNEKLAPILQELVDLPEFQASGFTPQEANLVIESFPDLSQGERTALEDKVPPVPEKALTKPGQLWKLGPHRLLCGDATDPANWERLMDGKKAALCVTDFPYGVDYNVSQKSILNKVTGKRLAHHARESIKGDENVDVAIKVLPHIFNHLIDEGVAYFTCGTNLEVDIINWLRQQGIHYGTTMVWHKHFAVVSWNRYHAEHELIIFAGKGSRPGKHARWFGPKDETTVWDIPLDAHGDRLHPTQKPVALFERPMVNSSAIGEIVIDPCAGAGGLVIAAEKHGRRAFLMDVEPRYCDVIIKRWMGFTNQKAVPIAA